MKTRYIRKYKTFEERIEYSEICKLLNCSLLYLPFALFIMLLIIIICYPYLIYIWFFHEDNFYYIKSTSNKHSTTKK